MIRVDLKAGLVVDLLKGQRGSCSSDKGPTGHMNLSGNSVEST